MTEKFFVFVNQRWYVSDYSNHAFGLSTEATDRLMMSRAEAQEVVRRIQSDPQFRPQIMKATEVTA